MGGRTMIFRKATIDDKPVFDRYKNSCSCSDYLFSYVFMYQDSYKLKIWVDNGTIVIRSDLADTIFYMPLGDTEYGIKSVLEYCKENNIEPVFSKIPENWLPVFKEFNFHIEEDRDSFDYIFKNSDLLEYKGKEFRNQRNNLQSYFKSYTPAFHTDVNAYLDKCKEFTLKYHNSHDKLEPTFKMLNNIEALGLKGGVVINDGEVSAFCLYEKLSDNMILSHVELTDNAHRGAHAYLVNELAKTISESYINKEDDMGIPGLRRFKETYNPSYMFKKYKAYYK
jgi:uncharacterized protein